MPTYSLISNVIATALLLASTGILRPDTAAALTLSTPQYLNIFTNASGVEPCITVGDINNDGIPDVVGLSYRSPYVRIALGRGNRTFAAGPTVQGTVFGGAVALADLNYDGKLDLIATDYYSGGFRIYFGSGDGTFGAPTYYGDTETTKYPQDIAIADFDGDGNLDVAIDSVYNSHVEIYYFNHSGVSTSRIQAAGGSTSGVVLAMDAADFDGDGAPDLYLSAFFGSVRQVISQLRNPNGITLSGFAGPGIGPSMSSLRAGDFLGNGKASMLITDNSKVFVLPQPSVTADNVALNSNKPNNAVFGDLDGDGRLDVLATSTDPNNSNFNSYGRVQFWRNTGNGNLASPETYLTGSGLASEIIVTDMDGDGNPDLVLGGGGQGILDGSVMWNNTPRAPTITTGNSASWVAGVSASFTCKGKGYPAPTFSLSGNLPSGVTFTSGGVLSGTPALNTAGVYPLVVTASNGVSPAATQNFTLTITGTVPIVTTPTFSNITSSSAHLGGNVESDNGFPITRRGVVYAPTSVNSNPRLGGSGVLFIDDPLVTTGVFTRTVLGLGTSTNYSFAAFAVNSKGTSYSTVAQFQTLAPPGSGSLVVTTSNDEDNGNSDPNAGAGTSLREAVAYSNALGGNQTITFSPNLSVSGPTTITLTLGTISLANLTGTTTISGPGASQLTISGNGTTRLFQMNEGGARLNGLRLANGNTIGDGAVIRSYGTLYANDCVFAQNVSNQGGAIYNGGLGVVSRCTFSNNSANRKGGAIANEGTLWAINSTFSSNSADNGGAVANLFSSSSVRLICSTITNNSATTAGGGLLINNPNVIVNNTIVSGNNAPSGSNISGTPNSSGLTSDLIDANPAAIFTTGILTNNGGPTPTIALKPGGLAINTGDNSLAIDNNFVALVTDQPGKPRQIGAKVDIGAYEMPQLPTLAAASVSDVTATSAILAGNVTADGYGIISQRGIVYSLTSQNSDPKIGAPVVMQMNSAGTTGVFSVPLNILTPLSNYSFATFTTNEAGTTYSLVRTFETTEYPVLNVTLATDTVNGYDAQTSLREALANAQSLGGPRTINFDPSLAGQTITLNTGWNGANDDAALRVSGPISVQGLTTSPGVTIAIGQGLQQRHITVESTGNLDLSNLTFTGGSGDYGGSIRSFGTLAIHHCTFTGNSASHDGGAVHGAAGSLSLFLENSTFSGNSTSTVASAIASGAQQNTYRYLTVTNNTGGGGTIDIYQNPATMIDCIVAGNHPDGIVQLNGGAFSAQSTNNLLGPGGSGGLTNGANGNQVGVLANQLYLGSLGNNGGPTATIPLLPGSPAIDAGVSIDGLTTDQRATARPQADAPDLGAFELVWTQAAAIPIVSPLGGTYQDSAEISIANTSAGSTVHYTLDNTEPSPSDGQIYSAPFTLTQNTTVKAIASGRGWLPSPVASVGYAVLAPLPYWRTLQGLAPDGSQDLANPSGDGVANLLKFAFNMAPNMGDLTKPNAGLLLHDGTAGLPLITRDTQGRLVIEFVRRKASGNPGVAYLVETSDDLAGWNSLTLTNASLVSIDATWERVTVTDPVISVKRFGRVRVQALP